MLEDEEADGGRIPAGADSGRGHPGDMLFPTLGEGELLGSPIDPAGCSHLRACRLGIQRFPFPPYRVYLLRCLACETTLTTGSIREMRRPAAPDGGTQTPPPPAR